MELQIQNLSKTYPNGVRALQDISLTIRPGMYGLLGPNGAGKSTLMNTLATLQQPDTGTIRFGEMDILREPQRLRQTLGYLPQEFGAYPGVSAESMLDYLAQLKGMTDARTRRNHIGYLLELVNLSSARKRSVDTYSGGMRQRFGIAQALIGNPRFIIVDEPTAGLDPAERNRFHSILSEIAEGTVVLLSTHIVEDVANLCLRMAILADGRIVAEGTPGDLTAALTGKMWQKTVSKAAVAEHRTRYRILATRMVGGQVRLIVHSDSAPADEFAPKVPDLEDVYFLHVPEAKENAA